MKPGYKTSEFAATIGAVAAILVLAGVLTPTEGETLNSAVLQVAEGIGAIIGIALVVREYIKSRTAVKTK